MLAGTAYVNGHDALQPHERNNCIHHGIQSGCMALSIRRINCKTTSYLVLFAFGPWAQTKKKPSTAQKSLAKKTKTGVTGNKEALLASAAYPPEFGEAVGKIMIMLQKDNGKPAKKSKCG